MKGAAREQPRTSESPFRLRPPREPPLRDHQREHESLRLPSDSKDGNNEPLRDPHYETFEYENLRALAPLQDPSCEEYTHSEYPQERESPTRVEDEYTQRTQDTIVTPSREMNPTKTYERTGELRSEPLSEEESSQDEHPEGTLMVLLLSTFPVLNENPYPEGEPHDETGSYRGV